jgi:flagellar motor switch protein FliN
MDINDLLAEVDGIGNDRFIPSGKQPVGQTSAPVVSAQPQELRVEHLLDKQPALIADSYAMVDDIEVEVAVELGQIHLTLHDLLQARPNQKFKLLSGPEKPLSIYVNNRLVAHGQALMVDGMLAVKISEFVT